MYTEAFQWVSVRASIESDIDAAARFDQTWRMESHTAVAVFHTRPLNGPNR